MESLLEKNAYGLIKKPHNFTVTEKGLLTIPVVPTNSSTSLFGL